MLIANISSPHFIQVEVLPGNRFLLKTCKGLHEFVRLITLLCFG